jgi:DNA-binding NtrC family response regulator
MEDQIAATQHASDRREIAFQRCKLVHVEPNGKSTDYEIDKDELVIGSADSSDVRIKHQTVSRKHCVIARTDSGYVLRDADSTNGTKVDGVRVKEAFLRPGADIRLGDAQVRFELAYRPSSIVASAKSSFGRLLGRSVRMREIFAVLEKVAASNATVLLEGDTGTGKSSVARAIHEASPRKDGPFVIFDCGAKAPTLIESELFGHERGAFTGAMGERHGALEEAQGGTLFIDELSELSLDLQPKLLRALEEREITRLGSNKTVKVDCRIIAATQKNLGREVLADRFRRDLYYRLAVVTIPLPQLRERKDDIPVLCDRFLGELGADLRFNTLDRDLQKWLQDYDWPGNTRELRNVVERFCVMGSMEASGVGHPGGASGELAIEYDSPFKDAKERLVSAFEKAYVKRLLDKTRRNIAEAARRAGLGRKHLYTLLAKHGLAEPGDESDEE